MESIWKNKLYSGQDSRTPECTRVVTRVKSSDIKKREELYTPSQSMFQLQMQLAHSWQELIGNGTASQQCKNILRNYLDYNKRQGFHH